MKEIIIALFCNLKRTSSSHHIIKEFYKIHESSKHRFLIMLTKNTKALKMDVAQAYHMQTVYSLLYTDAFFISGILSN